MIVQIFVIDRPAHEQDSCNLLYMMGEEGNPCEVANYRFAAEILCKTHPVCMHDASKKRL